MIGVTHELSNRIWACDIICGHNTRGGSGVVTEAIIMVTDGVGSVLWWSRTGPIRTRIAIGLNSTRTNMVRIVYKSAMVPT